MKEHVDHYYIQKEEAGKISPPERWGVTPCDAALFDIM